MDQRNIFQLEYWDTIARKIIGEGDDGETKLHVMFSSVDNGQYCCMILMYEKSKKENEIFERLRLGAFSLLRIHWAIFPLSLLGNY